MPRTVVRPLDVGHGTALQVHAQGVVREGGVHLERGTDGSVRASAAEGTVSVRAWLTTSGATPRTSQSCILRSETRSTSLSHHCRCARSISRAGNSLFLRAVAKRRSDTSSDSPG